MKDIYWHIDTSKVEKSKDHKWYHFSVPVPQTIINAAKLGYEIGLVGGRINLKGPAFFYLYSNIGEKQLINNKYEPLLASIILHRDTSFGMYFVQYVKIKQVLSAEIKLYIHGDHMEDLIRSTASTEPTTHLIFHCRSIYSNNNESK